METPPPPLSLYSAGVADIGKQTWQTYAYWLMGALSNEVSPTHSPTRLIEIKLTLFSFPFSAPQTCLLRRLLQGYPICRCRRRVAIGRQKIQLLHPVSVNRIYIYIFYARWYTYLLGKLQIRYLVGTLRFWYALRDSRHLVSHPRYRTHG